MTLLTKLENKLRWMAIDHLPLYIVTAQGLIYVWVMLNPDQAHLLTLNPAAVLYKHEYWRFLTFLFLIPLQNPIFAFFFLYILYVYGEALESEWGSFPFTLFYLLGALGTMVAAFFFGSRDGAFFINTSIFLAFAAMHPDFQLLLFFIIPIKVKWLALFTWLWFGYELVVAPVSIKAAILMSFLNYILFFGKRHWDQARDIVRGYQHRRRFKDWDVR